MKIKNLVLLLTILLITGCANQTDIKARGEGDYWQIEMKYVLANDSQEDSGTIRYNGNEPLKHLRYEFNYPSELGIGHSGEWSGIESERKLFNTGRSSEINPSYPLDNDKFIDAINNTTVLIIWETETGEEYEEIISLSSN